MQTPRCTPWRLRIVASQSSKRRWPSALSELRVVDVILPLRDRLEIRQRCVTQPSDHQKILLDRLGWRLPGTLQETQM